MLENELLEKCLIGDGTAFKQLINIYRVQLFGYLWRFSSSRFEAEEMFQETLIKVWKGLKKYNNQQKFSSWLFTIAHNVAMDSLRKRKTETNILAINENNDMESFARPDEDFVKKERIEIINRTVENLTEKQKSVFLLRQHGELTFKEIAETINEPLNTVISHMHYAVKKIKKQLAKEDEPQRRSVI
ncbi:MAG: RNA polymerase sigma factor [Ignavibacteriae bacterium]|nr:RNA polymerase sigma factor [Ignavibacteriota bacterium]